MTRTRIKICGITNPDDGKHAALVGADAIGLVFCSSSSRHVSLETAAAITLALPPFIAVVGVFVDPTPDQVAHIVQRIPLTMLQFHGKESAPFCQQFGLPYLKALPMGSMIDMEDSIKQYATAAGLLLDSHSAGEMGGIGRTFDWRRFPRHADKPLFLAGGLTPENIMEAVHYCRPYGVDVSSGVESGKGIKDPRRVEQFINNVCQENRC